MRLSILVLGACAGLCAGAGEIVVGAGETHVLNVAEAQVQTEAVRLADRAVLEKRGAGTLTLQTGTFTEAQPVSVNVREGTVKVTATDPLVTEYAQPTAVMEKAAFWLESETSLAMRVGSETDVAEWRDVRETGDGSAANPFLYPRAVTNLLASRVYPKTATFKTKPAIYFGGYGKGVWMNWVKPNNTQATIGKLRNVFIVHGAASGWGYVLGQRQGQSPFFQPAGTTIWIYHNFENRPMHASRTYLNGSEIDPFTTAYANNNSYVVEVECLGADQSAQCFFNDRDMQLRGPDGTNTYNAAGQALNAILGTTAMTGGGDRAGGEYIHEMLLFTNQLTTAERMAVANWLNRKWQGRTPPATPSVAVTLAPNAVYAVDGESAKVTLAGGGLLRKDGAGHVALRSTFAPRNQSTHVRVDEGTLALGYPLPYAAAAGDEITTQMRWWGPEYTPAVTGADATKLVKKGTGPLVLDAIPAGVKKIVVEGGELTLADPERAATSIPPVPAHAAATPGAADGTFDFECYTTQNQQFVDFADGGVKYGWHAIIPGLIDGKTQDSKVFLYNTAKGSRSGWGLPETAPNGPSTLVVKNNASAWTEIVVAEEGDYALSFWAAPRSGTYIGLQLDVMLGTDADHLVSLGNFRTSSAYWSKFSFLPVHLIPGTYQFWLKSRMLNDDRCTVFDDFQFVRQVSEEGIYKIPNGDFEVHDGEFNETAFVLDNTNRVPQFTVKQADNVGSTTADSEQLSSNIGGYTTFSVYGTDDWIHFNLPWNTPGSRTQFHMTGNGSELRTTVRPPAGTWRFAADFCNWQLTANTCHAYDAEVRATIGGVTMSLGVVSNFNHKLVRRIWPNAITVDGETDVTFTIVGHVHQGCTCGHGLFDNLVLVSPHVEGTSLLANGGFEGYGANWTVVQTPKPPLNADSQSLIGGSQAQGYDGTYRQYFGREAFEGSYCMKIVNDDWVYQTVNFPTGGLYRFSANFEGRGLDGSFGNGLNPVAFYVARNGVTNWLGCTDRIALTNFHEYAQIVRIPEAGGTYDVGFKGRVVSGMTIATKQDRTTLADGAQLYRIETARPLDLPANLELDLAAGTQLKLDFDGTNEIARLVLNGVSRVGVVSLAERSDLLGTLSGRGALFIRPKGTVILYR